MWHYSRDNRSPCVRSADGTYPALRPNGDTTLAQASTRPEPATPDQSRSANHLQRKRWRAALQGWPEETWAALPEGRQAAAQILGQSVPPPMAEWAARLIRDAGVRDDPIPNPSRTHKPTMAKQPGISDEALILSICGAVTTRSARERTHDSTIPTATDTEDTDGSEETDNPEADSTSDGSEPAEAVERLIRTKTSTGEATTKPIGRDVEDPYTPHSEESEESEGDSGGSPAASVERLIRSRGATGEITTRAPKANELAWEWKSERDERAHQQWTPTEEPWPEDFVTDVAPASTHLASLQRFPRVSLRVRFPGWHSWSLYSKTR